MKKITFQSLILLLLTLMNSSAFAWTDTIKVGDKRVKISRLKPGLRQYMVYYAKIENPKSVEVSIWNREIKMADMDGESIICIRQEWFGKDTADFSKIVSWNRKSNFSTKIHSYTSPKMHFTLLGDEKGIKIDNPEHATVLKGYEKKFDFPVFNWNLDIELFEMLDLGKNHKFIIPFYEPGSKNTNYVKYECNRSEKITLQDNILVDCWILEHNGGHGKNKYTQKFWISKKNHEFLKEESIYGDDLKVKLKLPATAPAIGK